MATAVPSESNQFSWISDPFFEFPKVATFLVLRFLSIIGLPINEMQNYLTWSLRFEAVLSGGWPVKDLRLDLCCRTTAAIRRFGLIRRLICLFAAYAFAQSYIGLLRFTRHPFYGKVDRVLLQAVRLMFLFSFSRGSKKSDLSTCRWMRAAQSATGKNPQTVHVINKNLTNTKREKLSKVFDREVLLKKRPVGFIAILKAISPTECLILAGLFLVIRHVLLKI